MSPEERAKAVARTRRWRENNPERYRANTRARRLANLERWLWLNARSRARKLGLDFDILPDDVVIPQFCPVLGIPLAPGEGCREDGSPSLDRIDQSRGYVRGNVLVVSWRANKLKGDATPDELRLIADFYWRRHG
jgi:hypothetical protein